MKAYLHKNFILNGEQFSGKEELHQFVKDKDPELRDFLSEWFDDSEFVKVKTSGSTGIPKEIRLKKEYMINSANATGKYFKLLKGTTALLCMPVKYIAGKMMLVRAMTLGWNLDVMKVSSLPLEKTDKKYDFSAMVPLQLYNSLDQIERIKKLIVGGGVVSEELIDKIQKVPTEIFATYGMTETITHIAVRILNTESRSEYYTILPGVKISTDERGCLVINAPKISDQIQVTNDLVKIISEDQFIWLGRYDNIINTGGIKIIPEEVERKISDLISSRYFISSKPDPKLGEKIVLYIEKDNDGISNDLLRQNLTKYEMPKEIIAVGHFIETPTGKIDRNKTKAGVGI